MSGKLSDKEKALLIFEKSNEEFKKCESEIKELREALLGLTMAFKESKTLLKRCLNEEVNNGNVHKDCEYYDIKSDCCCNYMMSKYCDLSFEVSRHDKCIKDMEVK